MKELEKIWTEQSGTLWPRPGDYSSVSSDNIQKFARAMYEAGWNDSNQYRREDRLTRMGSPGWGYMLMMAGGLFMTIPGAVIGAALVGGHIYHWMQAIYIGIGCLVALIAGFFINRREVRACVAEEQEFNAKWANRFNDMGVGE